VSDLTVFAKTATPAWSIVFGRGFGCVAIAPDSAAATSRPLPKIGSYAERDILIGVDKGA
jgi:hypothetical protein